MYASSGIRKVNEIWLYKITDPMDTKIRLIKINMATDKITSDISIATFNDKIPAFPKSKTNVVFDHGAMSKELFIKEYAGRKYLNIIGHATYARVDDNEFNRITTFLIDENTN